MARYCEGETSSDENNNNNNAIQSLFYQQKFISLLSFIRRKILDSGKTFKCCCCCCCSCLFHIKCLCCLLYVHEHKRRRYNQAKTIQSIYMRVVGAVVNVQDKHTSLFQVMTIGNFQEQACYLHFNLNDILHCFKSTLTRNIQFPYLNISNFHPNLNLQLKDELMFF